jgi:hypothetical protein
MIAKRSRPNAAVKLLASCFTLERSRVVQILAERPIIPTEIVRGFP